MVGRPNRGRGGGNGTRAAFEKDNLAALKSGAYSSRVRDPFADALAEWATKQNDGMGYLRDPSFAVAVQRWANRTAMADLLASQLAEHHAPKPCAGCRSCRSLEERWIKLDQSAERAGVHIGDSPASRADLLVSLHRAGVLAGPEEQARSLAGDLAVAFGLRPDPDAESDEVVDGELMDGGA